MLDVRCFFSLSLLSSHSSLFTIRTPIPCESRAPCQHDDMKQFLLGTFLSALIIPTLSLAQTKHLTEQLGSTVLYGDPAISPDGSRVAWVQSTAANPSKETYVAVTSGDVPPVVVNLAT